MALRPGHVAPGLERQGNLQAAVIAYAGFVAAAGLVAALLWIYPAEIGRLMTPAITPSVARHVTYRTLVSPVVFLVSIPIALASTQAAEAFWFLAFPLQAIVSRRFGLGPTLDAALGHSSAHEDATREPPIAAPTGHAAALAEHDHTHHDPQPKDLPTRDLRPS